MPHPQAGFILLWTLIGLVYGPPAAAQPRQAIDEIEDNSFLIEEAYNQESHVVQHILTARWGESRDEHPSRRGWDFEFTQEWPLFSQRHQLSYTIPFSFTRQGRDHQDGVGDIELNYRLQALMENEWLPAFAPRFTLILPTGSRNEGTGNGVVGYDWNLPFSKKLGSRFAVHANLGLTYLPDVRAPVDAEPGSERNDRTMQIRRLSPAHSLVSYNLGTSVIFALFPRFHLMLEWIGLFEDDLNEQGEKEHDFTVEIAPGIRTAVVNQDELQIVLGITAPIGLTRPADDHAVFLYCSVEHNLF
ncbi:MAG TPA: hypothetical protein VGX03_39315 [Candidatus Binatia bacterium]|jgi:hypothetical protein|nr:hypothetical protein [Candidatus Binatia bacterium]